MESNVRKNGLRGHRVLAIFVIAALIIACMVPISSMAGTPDYTILFTEGEEQTSVGIYAVDTDADADEDDIDDETGEKMLKGYLQEDAIPKLNEGFMWQDQNDVGQLYTNEDLLDIYIEKDMEFIAVDAKATNTNAAQSSDGKSQLTDNEIPKYIKTNISWSRTNENNVMSILRQNTFKWKWSDVQTLASNMVTEKSQVWDASNDTDTILNNGKSHYYTAYLPHETRTAWDAATWQLKSGSEADMRLFRGKFQIPSGIDSVGNFKLDTVTGTNRIQINDNMFVFIYPDSKDFVMDDSNYLDQLAFWATGSETPLGDVTSTYNAKFGGVENNKTSRIEKFRQHGTGWTSPKAGEITGGDEGLYLSDGIYMPVNDNNISSPVKVASGFKNYKNWIIDVYVQDVYGGGGMDQLYISMSGNTNPNVMIKYWVADTSGNLTTANPGGQSYYHVPGITTDDIGKAFKVESGTGDGQLDMFKPASGYASGTQENSDYKLVAANNVVNVIYSPVSKPLTYKKVEFKASEGGILEGDNQSGSFVKDTSWDETCWNDFDNIPVPTADEGYEFVGWQDQDGNILNRYNERTYEWPDSIDKDYVFTAIFNKGEEGVPIEEPKIDNSEDDITNVDKPGDDAIDLESEQETALDYSFANPTGIEVIDNAVQVLGEIAKPMSGGSGGNDVTIRDNEIAQSGGNGGAWALLNLILTILTGIIALSLTITFFTKRRENEDEETREERIETSKEEEQKIKKKPALRILSIIMTVLAIILFILTEDMTLPMIITDNYTIYHIVMFVITVLLATFSIKKYENDEIEEEPEMV